MDNRHFIPPAVNRRDFLRRAGNGFGAIALAALGTEQSFAGGDSLQSIGSQTSASRGARQAHHFFVHARRSIANGLV